ncbi:ring finger protein [Gregarina niphandrodes]|uniref:Ring finger protein n=1 Tax=Gregarina niphandrodes TaxID=110365 RepID=A0A023B0V4_GRENI|nr:ring finger protein [Gregarina niphandrodes]EZG46020.1 ring finger protein [Gregarina niphandrodes]|eukprot:XP_011132394.1 ring finger protein [Gregarina niphandrodes]
MTSSKAWAFSKSISLVNYGWFILGVFWTFTSGRGCPALSQVCLGVISFSLFRIFVTIGSFYYHFPTSPNTRNIFNGLGGTTFRQDGYRTAGLTSNKLKLLPKPILAKQLRKRPTEDQPKKSNTVEGRTTNHRTSSQDRTTDQHLFPELDHQLTSDVHLDNQLHRRPRASRAYSYDNDPHRAPHQAPHQVPNELVERQTPHKNSTPPAPQEPMPQEPMSQEALPQEVPPPLAAVPQQRPLEVMPQEALPQEALPQEALPQEAPPPRNGALLPRCEMSPSNEILAPPPENVSENAFESAVERTEGAQSLRWRGEPERLPSGIDEGEQRSPSSETSSFALAEEVCSICISPYEADDVIRLLPSCSHFYHRQCIDQWLMASGTCPLCQRAVDPAVNTPNT